MSKERLSNSQSDWLSKETLKKWGWRLGLIGVALLGLAAIL